MRKIREGVGGIRQQTGNFVPLLDAFIIEFVANRISADSGSTSVIGGIPGDGHILQGRITGKNIFHIGSGKVIDRKDRALVIADPGGCQTVRNRRRIARLVRGKNPDGVIAIVNQNSEILVEVDIGGIHILKNIPVRIVRICGKVDLVGVRIIGGIRIGGHFELEAYSIPRRKTIRISIRNHPQETR